MFSSTDLKSTVAAVEAYLKKMEQRLMSCSLDETLKVKQECTGVKNFYNFLTIDEGTTFLSFMNNKDDE